MIVRSIAVRGGRPSLLAAPIRQMCQRALWTETSGPQTTRAAVTEAVPDSPASAAQTAAAEPVAGRRAWGERPPAGADTAANDFITMSRLQRKTSRLGSSVVKRYVPGDLIRDPPAPRDVTLELLMASQTHVGHNAAHWNPGNGRYVLGVRQGVHIISLEQTAAHLRRAARVVEEVAYRAGVILFVGTRRGQMDVVVRAAELAGACHLFTKWTPGTITNRDQILRSAALQVVDEHDVAFDAARLERVAGLRERTKLEMRGIAVPHVANRDIRKKLQPRPVQPDLVVVLNPIENFVLLRECAQAAVPTIGVIDTDADPSRVTYAIPANDDSLRSIAVIAGVLGRAGEMGRKRRLRDAAAGTVLWETPLELNRFLSADSEEPQKGSSANLGGISQGRWMLKSGTAL